MRFLFENHDFTTERCGQFLDLTDDLLQAVSRSEVRNGMALVYSPHTTCSIVINEKESGFIKDFCSFMDELVPHARNKYYTHDDNDLRTENLEDPHETPNGHAHIRGTLLGSNSQAVPIIDGKLLLGRWQRVFFLELDRARERKVLVQVMGE